MEAIRKIVKRQGNTIVVELPKTFTAELVELIVLPVEQSDIDEAANSSQDINPLINDFQQYLLSWPVMSDDQYQDYISKKEGFKKWDKG